RRHGARLGDRIVHVRRVALLGASDAREVGERQHLDVSPLRDEPPKLTHLPRVGAREHEAARDHERPATTIPASRSLARWIVVRVGSAWRPAARRRRSCPSPKGRRSAVPCTSIQRPPPVMTRFMSTSARLSSSYARSTSTRPSTTPTLTAATLPVSGS